jgi:hypothetical protein
MFNNDRNICNFQNLSQRTEKEPIQISASTATERKTTECSHNILNAPPQTNQKNLKDHFSIFSFENNSPNIEEYINSTQIISVNSLPNIHIKNTQTTSTNSTQIRSDKDNLIQIIKTALSNKSSASMLPKVLKALQNAELSLEEIQFITEIVELAPNHLGKILKGYRVHVDDGGKLYQKWLLINSSTKKKEFDHTGTYTLNMPLLHTIRIGTFTDSDSSLLTSFQLENSSEFAPTDKHHRLHSINLAFNKRVCSFTNRNQGPYGSSKRNTSRPLLIHLKNPPLSSSEPSYKIVKNILYNTDPLFTVVKQKKEQTTWRAYSMDNLLAEGSVGSVYLLKPLGHMGKPKAIKIPHTHISKAMKATDPLSTIMGKILRDPETLNALKSAPGIMKLPKAQTDEDAVLMTYYPQGAISGKIKGEWKLQWHPTTLIDVKNCFGQLAAGLKLIHDHKMIAGDVKTANILMQNNTFVHCDLDNAQPLNTLSPLHTAHYQCLNDVMKDSVDILRKQPHLNDHYQFAGDVYSLGVVYQELLTNRLATSFIKANYSLNRGSILPGEEIQIKNISEELQKNIPQETLEKLVDLTAAMTHTDFSQRPTMDEVVHALNACGFNVPCPS